MKNCSSEAPALGKVVGRFVKGSFLSDRSSSSTNSLIKLPWPIQSRIAKILIKRLRRVQRRTGRWPSNGMTAFSKDSRHASSLKYSSRALSGRKRESAVLVPVVAPKVPCWLCCWTKRRNFCTWASLSACDDAITEPYGIRHSTEAY